MALRAGLLVPETGRLIRLVRAWALVTGACVLGTGTPRAAEPWPDWVALLISALAPPGLHELSAADVRAYFAPLFTLRSDPESLCGEAFTAVIAPVFVSDVAVSLQPRRDDGPQPSPSTACDRKRVVTLTLKLHPERDASPPVLVNALNNAFGPAQPQGPDRTGLQWSSAGEIVALHPEGRVLLVTVTLQQRQGR